MADGVGQDRGDLVPGSPGAVGDLGGTVGGPRKLAEQLVAGVGPGFGQAARRWPTDAGELGEAEGPLQALFDRDCRRPGSWSPPAPVSPSRSWSAPSAILAKPSLTSPSRDGEPRALQAVGGAQGLGRRADLRQALLVVEKPARVVDQGEPLGVAEVLARGQHDRQRGDHARPELLGDQAHPAPMGRRRGSSAKMSWRKLVRGPRAASGSMTASVTSQVGTGRASTRWPTPSQNPDDGARQPHERLRVVPGQQDQQRRRQRERRRRGSGPGRAPRSGRCWRRA